MCMLEIVYVLVCVSYISKGPPMNRHGYARVPVLIHVMYTQVWYVPQ